MSAVFKRLIFRLDAGEEFNNLKTPEAMLSPHNNAILHQNINIESFYKGIFARANSDS
jgi:hypothetical protein